MSKKLACAPRWELLAHVMLTLDAGRHSTDTTYRLRRITLRQVKADVDHVPQLSRARKPRDRVLREKGWISQGDVAHPDHDAIARDCMLDVVEALQPKYLSPKSDEWWHDRKEGETPDELLHGRTPARAFLESHVRLDEWLRQRGITMMIYEDMLSPYHNGKRSCPRA